MIPASPAAASSARTWLGSSAQTPIAGHMGERGQPLQFLPADDLVGDEHVLDAAMDHRLGLADLLQHTPTAPSAICFSAMTGHLWVLACGRTLTPVPAIRSGRRRRLRSNASRSTIRAGVSTSSRGMPISAGGRVVMAGPPRIRAEACATAAKLQQADPPKDDHQIAEFAW